jgi:replicative DNA helicase
MSEQKPLEDLKKNQLRNRLMASRSEINLSDFVFGKVPPQARDLEEAVLGAVLLESNALTSVIDILKPESFYVEAHRIIFSAIVELFDKSQPVDLMTVTDKLRSMGQLENIGGAFTVTELTNKVSSSANVEYYARIIMQKYIQRELIRISSSIIQSAYEDTTDVLELLDAAERDIFQVTDKNLRNSYSKIDILIKNSIKKLEQIKATASDLTGVPTGFIELDRITSGWQPGDLIILAARPSMGKTAFALSLVRNAAVDYNKPVAVFSLEMSNLQLTNRLLSGETGISGNKLRNGNLQDYEWTQLTTKSERLSNAPIFIDDTPQINIFELRAKCRRLKASNDIQLIIIDYLQLMSSRSENRNVNREQEISNISRSLKSLAKELEVPVIALSQLSREVEKRAGDKKPQLSDLRESGAIEQDADLVMFLYRPDYYQAEGKPNVTTNQSYNPGETEVLIQKHRNGKTGSVKLRFIPDTMRFENAPIDDYQDNSGFGFTNNAEPNIITKGSRMNGDSGEQDTPF